MHGRLLRSIHQFINSIYFLKIFSSIPHSSHPSKLFFNKHIIFMHIYFSPFVYFSQTLLSSFVSFLGYELCAVGCWHFHSVYQFISHYSPLYINMNKISVGIHCIPMPNGTVYSVLCVSLYILRFQWLKL